MEGKRQRKKIKNVKKDITKERSRWLGKERGKRERNGDMKYTFERKERKKNVRTD